MWATRSLCQFGYGTPDLPASRNGAVRGLLRCALAASSWEIALNGALIARLTPPAGGFGFHDRESYQAIFCRRRHQPRRPPPAKTRPGNSAPAMGLHVITAIALVPFILISIPCCCSLVLVSTLAEVSSRFQT